MSRTVALSTLAAGLFLLAMAADGCGSETSPATETQGGGAAERQAPKGASPVLRAVYRQFPAPEADPQVSGSAAAIKAGERACKGKAPLQVKQELFAVAKSNLVPEQVKLIARIESFEKSSAKDPSFTAGQLAADVYEATLPKATGQYGYQGCIYALVRGLEHRLAPR